MLLIEHRVNTRDHLAQVPTEHGIEVDIRDYNGALRLAHDPLQSGELLEDFVAAFQHSLIVFNVKCDGLEQQIIELATKYRVQNYFFVDVASPTLVTLARTGIHNVAVRYSEYEPIELALSFAGAVDWVWVDGFTRLPLDRVSYDRLREHFKICVVSPELHGHPRETIQSYRLELRNMSIDAVCTDYRSDWL